MKLRKLFVLVCLAALLPAVSFADTPRESDAKVDAALDRFHREVKGADQLLADAKAVLVLPEVVKGGLIVGGAYGRGTVFEQGAFLGYSDITQATVGLQAGGQSFAELVVFETRTDLNRFTAGKLALAANISAVILKSGAADSARYTDGVAVFVEPIGGAMVEAAIGGQQFTFDPK